eukprot:scaffold178391_cov21-Tisochrysis_lutea.AAC.1
MPAAAHTFVVLSCLVWVPGLTLALHCLHPSTHRLLHSGFITTLKIFLPLLGYPVCELLQNVGKCAMVPIPVCVSMECPDFPPSLHTMHAIYTHHARAHTHATEHLQLVERHGQHVQAQLIHAFIAQGVAAEVHLGEAAECE